MEQIFLGLWNRYSDWFSTLVLSPSVKNLKRNCNPVTLIRLRLKSRAKYIGNLLDSPENFDLIRNLTLLFGYIPQDYCKIEFLGRRLGNRLQLEFFIFFHPSFVYNCSRQLCCSWSLYIVLIFCLQWQLFLNLWNFSVIFCTWL